MSASPHSRPLREFEHESDLWDWVSNTDQGLWPFEFGDVPESCTDFITSQFQRFGIPFPTSVFEVASAGASAAFYVACVIDPYALFSGTSDVVITDDWGKFTYELLPWDGAFGTTEAPPEFTESFMLTPHNDEAWANGALGQPGLKALPGMIGEHIEDCLVGQHNAEELYDAIDEKTELALRDLCTVNGQLDKARFQAYFELAAWAGFIWLAGPGGRDYRNEHIMIFNSCHEHGECILIEGTIIEPTHYKKHSRPPKACIQCEVQTWCVELTMDGVATVHICEKCLYGGFPSQGIATCGTKLCRDSSCMHHPFHNLGREGGVAAARAYGQLNAMAKSGTAPRIQGPDARQLRLGL